MTPSSGRFITLEGGEGAGKTTQARLLAESLARIGIDALVTREPGGSPGAEQIRHLLVEGEVGRWDAMTETLLLFAARRDHLRRTIRPAIESGQWVISDRFTDSTMAYQGYGHGLGPEVIRRFQELVIGDFQPDVTILLDLPVEIGLARTVGRTAAIVEDRFERMDVAFHHRLRQAFLDIAAHDSTRCAVVNASDDIETVHRAMAGLLGRKFGLNLTS
ncbi:MAG: dTMP kinase [Alphaproteobacteria bacterium]